MSHYHSDRDHNLIVILENLRARIGATEVVAAKKTTTYYQEEVPTSPTERDLWVRVSDSKLHIYTASGWVATT